MTANGEVDALVPERVWQEISRGLMEAQPSRMFLCCANAARWRACCRNSIACSAYRRTRKAIRKSIPAIMSCASSTRPQLPRQPLPVRYAALLHDLGKGLTPKENWPNHGGHEAAGLELVKQVGSAPARAEWNASAWRRSWRAGMARRINADKMGADGLLDLLEQTDAFRRPDRFELFCTPARRIFMAGRAGKTVLSSRPIVCGKRWRQRVRSMPAR
jgi:tRNA nucleotidyltransferase (CCA-adding enzyme)